MMTEVVASNLRFPECPRWWDDSLWFVDGPMIKVLSADGSLAVHAQIDCQILNGLAAVPGGGYLVSDAVGRKIWSVDERGKAEVYVDLSEATPFMINEIMLLADGSLVVSDIGFDVLRGAEPRAVRLIRVGVDKSISRTGSAMLFGNGMVAASGGTELFVAATFGGQIWHYRQLKCGELDSGYPIANGCTGIDGLAVAPDRSFWYACHTNGEVVHLDERGHELARIASGLKCATSCVLNRDGSAIYVTALAEMPSADLALSNTGAVVRIML